MGDLIQLLGFQPVQHGECEPRPGERLFLERGRYRITSLMYRPHLIKNLEKDCFQLLKIRRAWLPIPSNMSLNRLVFGLFGTFPT